MFEFVNLMPRFPIPAEFESEDALFAHTVWEGMAKRYPNGIDDTRRKQAEYEIGIITQMGFPAYFLVVADFINWAKNNGVAVGPGRGSAAGSIVAYAMGITDLDPLDHGLIFERFLNPERISMPDIDIDFDERGRADVIRYVTQKWGATRSPRSSPTARSRRRPRSRTPPGSSASPTPSATASPRRSRRR